MRIAQVLSLLYFLASSSWGFAPADNQRTPTSRHHRRTKNNVFRRESNEHANNNNKLVYFSGIALFQAAFVQPIGGGANVSDVVVVKTKRKKKVTATSSSKKAVLSSAAGKQQKQQQQQHHQRRVKVLVSKSRQPTLSGTTTKRVVQVKSDKIKPSRLIWKLDNDNALEAQVQWNTLFEQLVKYKRQHGDCMVPTQFQENPQLGIWVKYQRKCYKCDPKTISADHIQRLDDIGFVWDVDDAQWESRFIQLVEYKQRYGDCLVPKQFPENPQLGRWVQHQRKCYNCEPKTISDARIQRLESIGFVWDVHDAQWELRFNQLVEYKQQHGDCLVPTQFDKNLQLAVWVNNQRKCYKTATKTISDERIQRLESIGFVWYSHESKWELRFDQLVEYKHRHGDCLVPDQFQENPGLAMWVSYQRKCYKSEPKIISEGHIQSLDDIGFVWDVRDTQWELRFNELVEYKQQHGNCLVPYRFQDNPELGLWVYHQRKCYKNEPKMISAERIQLLEDIGFEWDAHDAQWELRFNQLLEYKQRYGNCVVPYRFQENPELGHWVNCQRQYYRSEPKAISDDRIQRLESISIEWDVLDAQWELRFEELVEYKQRYGDCLVPYLFQENPELGYWVGTQRKLYKQVPKMISKDCEQRLDNIGFVWDVYQADWESRYKELLEYKQQYGNCLVLQRFQENPQLGKWVQHQREHYKSDPKTISDDRIQRLDDIGFEWDYHKAQWELRFNQLVEYKQQHGNCLVPERFRKNPELGRWVCRQRQLYKQVPTLLSEEYTQRLNDIGFAWVGRYIEWEEGFEALLEYKQQYGDCLVPKWFPEDPLLARWVQRQRKCYKSEPKRITDKRILRLEHVGFVWDVHDAQWELRFNQLVEYKRQHGDCLVPRRFRENDQHLGYWIGHQRKCYNSEPKTISDERIQRLESIGFVWDVHDAQWELRFNQLVEYKQQHGDCLVPTQFDKNPQLGCWVSNQRQYYRCKPKMISADRIQRLDAIGFEWDASKSW